MKNSQPGKSSQALLHSPIRESPGTNPRARPFSALSVIQQSKQSQHQHTQNKIKVPENQKTRKPYLDRSQPSTFWETVTSLDRSDPHEKCARQIVRRCVEFLCNPLYTTLSYHQGLALHLFGPKPLHASCNQYICLLASIFATR